MSTYSPDLRIELITPGTQVGVWGTTTNTNLGTLLEEAIAGYTAVLVTAAAQAFTVNNGAQDEARFASIALTTTTSAPFSVYAPPNPKQYVIYNASAYAAAIYNSTVVGNTTPAGTGILVPAGKTMTVWSDGTNFSQQNNYLYAPQLSNVVLTGTTSAPTQVFGDNTTSIATTAFTQAALQALYPVGAIYSSTVSTNPGAVFGFGTWAAFASGRVLIGDGGGYTAGSTGGSADATIVSHSHTANSAVTDPGHTHNYTRIQTGGQTTIGTGGVVGNLTTDTTASAQTGITVATTVNSTGSSGTGANLQPYVVVYMWNRTA